MSYNIPSDVEEKLKSFFKKFNFINKIVVFGSRARGDNSSKSDIDLCIYSLGMTPQEYRKLKLDLNELPILYKIDIVHFENSSDELKKNILKDEKLFLTL